MNLSYKNGLSKILYCEKMHLICIAMFVIVKNAFNAVCLCLKEAICIYILVKYKHYIQNHIFANTKPSGP